MQQVLLNKKSKLALRVPFFPENMCTIHPLHLLIFVLLILTNHAKSALWLR